jgi:hypothetical protein
VWPGWFGCGQVSCQHAAGTRLPNARASSRTDCMTSVAACRGTQELGAQHHALASAYLRRESADEMIRP